MPSRQTELTDIHYWLALKFIPRLGVTAKLSLVERYTFAEMFDFQHPPTFLLAHLTPKQYQAVVHPNWQKITAIIEASQQHCAHILTYDNPCYPQLLKQIYDPPLVLFVQGNTALLNENQLAVVGSRSATLSGLEQAKKFSQELSTAQLVITSGLALGIDTAAHQGALLGTGKTIAVVASGLDIVYPSRNKKLAQDIIKQGGAIVSEFVPETKPKAGLFPKRNRLISGMSVGVLVIEAEIKSGSLITARCALEHNREIFAMPGSIHNPLAKGCHYLIKQGAKLVDDAADIVEEFESNSIVGLNLSKIIDKEGCDKESTKEGLCIDPLLDSVGYEITPVDVVVSRSELPTEVVLTQLTMLELRGLVSAVPGGYLRVN